MCSVSLVRCQDNLLLTMNRDERRDRHESGLSVDGLQIYPVDSYAGGTWCGANKNGLLAALLNRYQDVHESEGTISRGTLIPALLKHRSLEEAAQFMTTKSLERFNPFTLLVSDQSTSYAWSWNGVVPSLELNEAQPFLFYSSSSIDVQDITEERSLFFRNTVFAESQVDLNAQKILAAHVSRGGTTHSRAILMDRTVSHTKSIVQIKLNPSKLQFDYYDEKSLGPVRQGLQRLPSVADSASFDCTTR